MGELRGAIAADSVGRIAHGARFACAVTDL